MIDWDRFNGRGADGLSPRWYVVNGLAALVTAVALLSSGLMAFGAIVLVLVPLSAYKAWQSYRGRKVWSYRRWRE